MKIQLLLASAFLLGLTTVHAQVNSLPSQPHLLVKGQAERSVEPDRFKVDMRLQRVDLSPGQARKLAQADAASILKAFGDHHALPETVEASTLSIEPHYEYEQNKQVFKGTQVSRNLTATFNNISDVREFLAEITTSTHVMLTGISAQYSGEPRLRAQLKREAAEQSRESAQGLASAYGTRIKSLYTISDVAPSFAYGVQAGSWPRELTKLPPPPQAPAPEMIAEARPTDAYRYGEAESLEAGAITISENVYAIFLIAQ